MVEGVKWGFAAETTTALKTRRSLRRRANVPGPAEEVQTPMRHPQYAHALVSLLVVAVLAIATGHAIAITDEDADADHGCKSPGCLVRLSVGAKVVVWQSAEKYDGHDETTTLRVRVGRRYLPLAKAEQSGRCGLTLYGRGVVVKIGGRRCKSSPFTIRVANANERRVRVAIRYQIELG
jgi:hypothetical protein